MQLGSRGDLARQVGDAQILDDQRIRAGLDDLRQRARRLGQLVIEHDRVEVRAQSILLSGTTSMPHSIA